ncbi:LOW QUALITY PROTEIN: bifunctional D-cysteine desulfhydrase/1-aminocyclopropane-1-carboxylate deaminase, mitochondrial-like [Pomacea canaliculata]|uniref:LOW QUALITY PROTEIN: bifunctional D-cysteine desulfhydrase/1-aminocyclopropane-1-carboxylate deaminase, mitochondrial-like n=1 Tax=Pomacea canaliculata TaxID=400727 RepID=UPI000D73C1D7|nr:LOW QUALITY PROTEIN: bifunctional D-cysteine desulfhydrase/1-aminocyclopropane-1-carboxylate deaminase, mitochondrial-like [Pomacea canaliculata]
MFFIQVIEGRTNRLSRCVVWLTCNKSRNSACFSTQTEIETNKTASTGIATVRYDPPDWANNLAGVPKRKIQLAHPNTPIHRWALPGLPEGFSVFIKRDDMTGSTLSGNKVRKLEFLLADALDKGCSHVITCGSVQSNHCRAVAVAARQIGLTPHLFLRSAAEDVCSLGCEGNVLVDRMSAADIYLIPKMSPYLTHQKPRMEKLAEESKARGENSYLIPVGGSDHVGLFGYINVVDELQKQNVMEDFDDVVFACGSGGTASGLSIGNYLSGSNLKVHGVAVSDNAKYFHEHCNEMMQEIGLKNLSSEDLLDIIEGHKGLGYGVSSEEELNFISQVAGSTGIFLDPTYTGKAALGMVKEIKRNPSRFKGNRILFLHTGGVFELFDGRMSAVLQKKEERQVTIRMWPDVNGPYPH